MYEIAACATVCLPRIFFAGDRDTLETELLLSIMDFWCIVYYVVRESLWVSSADDAISESRSFEVGQACSC